MMIKSHKFYASTALILSMISITSSAFAMKEGDEGEKEPTVVSRIKGKEAIIQEPLGKTALDEGEKETTEAAHMSRKKTIIQEFLGETALNELTTSKSAKALEVLDPIFGVGRSDEPTSGMNSDEANKGMYLQARYILDFCKLALRKPYNEERYTKAQESLKTLLIQGNDQGENLEFIKDHENSVIMSKQYLHEKQSYFDLYESEKEEEALGKILSANDSTDFWLLLKIMSEKGASRLQEGTRKQFSDYLFEHLTHLEDVRARESLIKSLVESEPNLSLEEIDAKVSETSKGIHSWVKSRIQKYNYDSFIKELFADNHERFDFYTKEFGAE